MPDNELRGIKNSTAHSQTVSNSYDLSDLLIHHQLTLLLHESPDPGADSYIIPSVCLDAARLNLQLSRSHQRGHRHAVVLWESGPFSSR